MHGWLQQHMQGSLWCWVGEGAQVASGARMTPDGQGRLNKVVCDLLCCYLLLVTFSVIFSIYFIYWKPARKVTDDNHVNAGHCKHPKCELGGCAMTATSRSNCKYYLFSAITTSNSHRMSQNKDYCLVLHSHLFLFPKTVWPLIHRRCCKDGS